MCERFAPPSGPMTTAFVLLGGASLGAVQVGMLLALAETAIVPDVLVGTSVGAVNAAWVAGRPGPDGARELAEVWSRLRREDVFPARPLYGLLGLAGRRTSILPDTGLRALLARHLPAHRFEDTTRATSRPRITSASAISSPM